MRESIDKKPTFADLFKDDIAEKPDTRERPTSVFMCRADWEYELLNDTSRVYPTIEKLKEERKCVEGCGIVELEFKLKRIVEQGTLNSTDAKENISKWDKNTLKDI
ncbi:MAG: hypothetical protein PHO76_07850 [Methylotenera sp.]|nr:hypothetical protein [Methylotenera sp.]MDD4924904.1 hypothetical protein [Methylotenera sp.]